MAGGCGDADLFQMFLDRFERMAVALEVIAASGSLGKTGKPSDAEVLHYMRGLGLPLPPIRTIAEACGCSHAYIYRFLPLSRAYFRQHNGKFRKGRRPTVDAENEGRFDE